MIAAILSLGGIGLVAATVLGVAAKKFAVEVDPREAAVLEVLPGANCGGCGLPGCSANAEAIVAGKASPNSCVAAGEDVALAIAGILGVSVEAKEPDIALPGCTYGVADADVKYNYDGLNDCRAAALLAGVGVGIFEDIPAGLAHIGKPTVQIIPNDERVGFYTDQMAAYQAACTQVRQTPKGG